MIMKLIAHRGNLFGPNPAEENNPDYVKKALEKGFDAEVDLWLVGAQPRLGHDRPEHDISHEFLLQPNLWIHCKNIPALHYCKAHAITNPYFWHQEDDVTLTSTGLFWTYPGKPLTPFSIAVMPETSAFEDISRAQAICTDYAFQWKHDLTRGDDACMHLVLITSVVNPLASASVFSREERFLQLLESIDSVRAHVPHPHVVVLEGGQYTDAEKLAVQTRGAEIFAFPVNRLHKQQGEASLLNAFLSSPRFLDLRRTANVRSISKLSGRYLLKDAFQFQYDGETCMAIVVPPERSPQGLGHVETRFYSVPIVYVDRLCQAIRRCCCEGIFIDMEHSLYKYEAVPLDKVTPRATKLHVGGYLAPTGQYIED